MTVLVGAYSTLATSNIIAKSFNVMHHNVQVGECSSTE